MQCHILIAVHREGCYYITGSVLSPNRITKGHTLKLHRGSARPGGLLEVKKLLLIVLFMLVMIAASFLIATYPL